ncbi:MULTISPECIES: universal stress protein [Haloferax]|uniref:Universal stress protein n=1 Tax=Haloferax marinum TaxID=2666143 RepID=A0A6A8G7N0_9EURY|nr:MULTISPECIES: universal stress protein [Haloferax]KAB1197245.1 universal stress protein [Haloferax sp. CBA1150]MRW96283.1 universal stress protein [Haloferax marinum]
MSILERVVVPVADERDAIATVTALAPYLADIQHVTVVHVIEKGGGVVDKAPMEKRVTDANGFLSTVETRLGERVTVETRVEFGTNVAEKIVATARETDATAIAYHSRGGTRLARFLSGDTTTRLVTDPELPVVSLDSAGRVHTSPNRYGGDDDTEVSG